MRAQGRLKQSIPVLNRPAYTFWDIGASDGTAIWVLQELDTEWRIIHFKEGWGEAYNHYTTWLQGLGITFAEHFLPHDAEHVRQGQTSNKSPRTMLEELMPGQRFTVVPVIGDINWGIEQTRQVFPLLYMDETECKEGLIHLENYRKKWQNHTQTWGSEPDKTGGHSEAADALRQFAQAYTGGLINVRIASTPKKQRKGSWRTA
jgi:hypothetical protein